MTTHRTKIGRSLRGAALCAALGAVLATQLTTPAGATPRAHGKKRADTAPVLQIVSPLADSSVARGEAVPGQGSFEGSGFAFNVEVVTRDAVTVSVNEGPNIRHPELLGEANPDFPGFTATADVDLITPDGGIIPAGTNLASLFNVAGTDDTPGPGVTVWAGWHVLESLPPEVDAFTLKATVRDDAGRKATDRITVTVDDIVAPSGQDLTPGPSPVTGDGIDDVGGPEVELLAPRVPSSIATGPDFAPPPGSGSLSFIQVNSTDRAGDGIGVSENGTGNGSFRDAAQIGADGPNRNMPGLEVTFDAPLRQPNGNLVPAGQNLAPLFDVAGSELDRDGAVRTVADWVVGGSLELAPGTDTVDITARVTDTAGRTGSDRITVGISETEDGQQLTPRPKRATPPARALPRLAADLDGAQEVGPTGTTGAGDPDGAGTFDAILSADAGTLCYRLRVDGIAGGSRFHIHRGVAGANGPIVVPFFETGEEPRGDACVTVDPALGRAVATTPSAFYVNVHNAEHPAGAVRGQLR